MNILRCSIKLMTSAGAAKYTCYHDGEDDWIVTGEDGRIVVMSGHANASSLPEDITQEIVRQASRIAEEYCGYEAQSVDVIAETRELMAQRGWFDDTLSVAAGILFAYGNAIGALAVPSAARVTAFAARVANKSPRTVPLSVATAATTWLGCCDEAAAARAMDAVAIAVGA